MNACAAEALAGPGAPCTDFRFQRMFSALLETRIVRCAQSPRLREGRSQHPPGRVALLLVLLLLPSAGCGPGGRSPATYAGPVDHVVVISLDTTRADHFGCYGNPWIRTPRLDALASESIQLLDYMTVATTTLASHVSLFTGKYPHSHGVPRNGFVVNPGNVLLAQLLEEAGFHAAGFLGSFALDSRFGLSRGFDHYDEMYSTLMGEGGADQNQRRADEVTDAVIHYLDRHGVPRNLFLFVHYFDPHLPYAPPPPYDTMYSASADPSRIEMVGHPALETGSLSPEEQQNLARYAGEISFMDEQVGRLLDDLEQRGILDRALVVVTSDHGENLGDAPGAAFEHGWTVYEVETRAVGLIRLPKAERGGTKSRTLVAAVDILPTMLRYLGLPAPAGVEGEALDLVNLPRAADARLRFAEATKPWGAVEKGAAWANLRKANCARSAFWKFIRTPYQDAEELFDLREDPRERNNLLAVPARSPGTVENELRAALESWSASGKPLPSEFEPNQEEETLRRLRSLGYLGGGVGDGGD